MNAQDIVKVLDELGAKLQGPAAHVWEIAVRQQFISAVAYIVLWVLLAVPAIIAFAWAVRHYQRRIAKPPTPRSPYDYHSDDEPTFIEGAVGVGSGFAIVLTAILVLAGGPTVLTMLLNPEWSALQSISGLVVK